MPQTLQKVENFKRLLEKKGLKYTYERKTICEEVLRLKEHFDADSLYERFKKKGLRIARDTVYRTIPLLLESGVVQKSVGTGKREFFERFGDQGHHDHMICIACGTIIEFQCTEIEELQDEIARKYGFTLTFHDHRLFGYCSRCRA
ncbi:MAG: transcriptional repressor [Candidatus Omnitrophica bacterium]|nr:transcriptional repressor [Candidatus Omnitrophota bacterium]